MDSSLVPVAFCLTKLAPNSGIEPLKETHRQTQHDLLARYLASVEWLSLIALLFEGENWRGWRYI